MLHGQSADDGPGGDAGLFLHVGLSSGVLQRTEVDRITGKGGVAMYASVCTDFKGSSHGQRYLNC